MSIRVRCQGWSKDFEFSTLEGFANVIKTIEVEANAYLTKLIQPIEPEDCPEKKVKGQGDQHFSSSESEPQAIQEEEEVQKEVPKEPTK